LVYIKTNNYHLNTIQTKQRWLEATNSPDEDMSIEESDDNQERAHTDQGNEVNEGETNQLEYSLTLQLGACAEQIQCGAWIVRPSQLVTALAKQTKQQ
jgi:hypothetical protein